MQFQRLTPFALARDVKHLCAVPVEVPFRDVILTSVVEKMLAWNNENANGSIGASFKDHTRWADELMQLWGLILRQRLRQDELVEQMSQTGVRDERVLKHLVEARQEWPCDATFRRLAHEQFHHLECRRGIFRVQEIESNQWLGKHPYLIGLFNGLKIQYNSEVDNCSMDFRKVRSRY